MLIKLFSREYSVQYCQASLLSLGANNSGHIPQIVKSQCYVPENSNEVCCVERAEWNLFMHEVEQKYKDKSEDFVHAFHHFGQNYVTAAQKMSTFPLAQASSDQLLQLYDSYLKILNIYTAYLWLGYLLNNHYAQKGEQALVEKHISPEAKAGLFSPTEKSSILELMERLRMEGKLSEERKRQLCLEFRWMSCLDVHNDPWDEEKLEEFAAHLPPRTQEMDFLSAAHETGLSIYDMRLFSTIKEFAYIKDMRDVYRRQGICAILPLFDEIGKRMQLKRKEVAYLTNEEIQKGLQGTLPSKSAIEERMKGFLMFWEGGKIKVTCDETQIKGYKERLETVIKEQQVRGTVACQGTATGRAKIVFGVSDLAKVEKGDVMIALTTHPDFVPAMQKASAIVTEEGGMTCHAAIVSRELKIPCIVSALHATSVFKDGDIVQVDAVGGVVRKQ